MSAGRAPKLLIDEDLSPRLAIVLRGEDGIDAVAVRERGLLGASDAQVLDLAFAEDRILVTGNVKDFERLARGRELHGGIVAVIEGDLTRDEQLVVIRRALGLIEAELARGSDTVNRILKLTAADHEWLEVP